MSLTPTRRALRKTGALAALALCAAVPAAAQTYNFTTLTGPAGAVQTFAQGLNDSGNVAGYYIDSANATHGFLYTKTSNIYTSINDTATGAVTTFAQSINNAGVVAGYYVDGASIDHGFVESNGVFSTVNIPSGANGTQIFGINSAGQIVGSYTDSSAAVHGFIENGTFTGNTYNTGSITTLDDGTNGTVANGINSTGKVVGNYLNGTTFTIDGFVYSGGTFTAINDSNGTGGVAANGNGSTSPQGINTAGTIAGFYQDGAGGTQGFLDTGGVFKTISDPSAADGTEVFAINNTGQLAGFYMDSGGLAHGFTAIAVTAAPEPAAWVTLGVGGLGLLGLSVRARRRS